MHLARHCMGIFYPPKANNPDKTLIFLTITKLPGIDHKGIFIIKQTVFGLFQVFVDRAQAFQIIPLAFTFGEKLVICRQPLGSG